MRVLQLVAFSILISYAATQEHKECKMKRSTRSVTINNCEIELPTYKCRGRCNSYQGSDARGGTSQPEEACYCCKLYGKKANDETFQCSNGALTHRYYKYQGCKCQPCDKENVSPNIVFPEPPSIDQGCQLDKKEEIVEISSECRISIPKHLCHGYCDSLSMLGDSCGEYNSDEDVRCKCCELGEGTPVTSTFQCIGSKETVEHTYYNYNSCDCKICEEDEETTSVTNTTTPQLPPQVCECEMDIDCVSIYVKDCKILVPQYRCSGCCESSSLSNPGKSGLNNECKCCRLGGIQKVRDAFTCQDTNPPTAIQFTYEKYNECECRNCP